MDSCVDFLQNKKFKGENPYSFNLIKLMTIFVLIYGVLMTLEESKGYDFS